MNNYPVGYATRSVRRAAASFKSASGKPEASSEIRDMAASDQFPNSQFLIVIRGSGAPSDDN